MRFVISKNERKNKYPEYTLGRKMKKNNRPSLTFTNLWANSDDKKFVIFFLFSPENRI